MWRLLHASFVFARFRFVFAVFRFFVKGLFFWYCSVILCVCVCAEVEQEQHMAPRKVSTRGHVLFTGVLCVACLLCVRFVCLCLCRVPFVLLPLQVEQPRIQDSNELNVHFGYVLRVQ